MVYWGFDISNHQGLGFDFAAARAGGFSYAMFKCSEGSGYADPTFTDNLNRARAAGLKVAAYHYQRPDPVADQLALIRRMVPLDCDLIFDVEDGSGSFAVTLALINGARSMGYRVPMLYLPKWYWQQIGSPDMRAANCPLWYSLYADNNGGYASQIWARARSWYLARWGGYGGLSMAIMQFTSSATVAGRAPIDASVFRGTQEQLDALFGGEEEDLNQEQDTILRDIREQLCGEGARSPGQFPGWKSWINDKKLTLVDYLRANDINIMGKNKSHVAGSEVELSMQDGAYNGDAYGYENQNHLLEIKQAIEALKAASTGPIATKDELRQMINDAIEEKLSIKGTVQITGEDAPAKEATPSAS